MARYSQKKAYQPSQTRNREGVKAHSRKYTVNEVALKPSTVECNFLTIALGSFDKNSTVP